MFRFFRKLRENLLAKNRASQYMLYALGEIVLVVIGILIALQINTWNEERQNRQQEKGIVSTLKQEFHTNRLILNEVLIRLEKTRKANIILMDLFGRPEDEIASFNTDSLIFESLEYTRFVPSQNSLEDLIQSGKLQLISNDSLKNLLYDWTRVMGRVDEEYSGVKQKTEEELLAYLTTRYPLKDMDKYGVLNWKESSRLPIEKRAVFKDITYENLIDDFLYRLTRYINNLEEAGDIMDKIISQKNSTVH